MGNIYAAEGKVSGVLVRQGVAVLSERSNSQLTYLGWPCLVGATRGHSNAHGFGVSDIAGACCLSALCASDCLNLSRVALSTLASYANFSHHSNPREVVNECDAVR